MSSPAWIILITAILLLPFFYLEETIDPVMVPRFLALSGVVLVSTLVLILKIIREPGSLDFSFGRRAMVLAMISYLLFSGLSIINSTCVSEGLFDLSKATLAFLFFMLITLGLNGYKSLTGISIKTLILVGFGLSLMAILQYFNLGFGWIPGHEAAEATMANKNLLASFLFLTIPAALYGVLRYKGFWRVAVIFSISLSLYIIIIGQTRAVWAALILAALFSFLLFIFMRRKFIHAKLLGLKRIMFAMTAVFVIFLAAVLTLSIEQRDTNQKQLFNTSDASLKQRLLLWHKTLRMSADDPLLGTGLSDWKIVLPEYGTEGLPSESGVLLFQRPHNDFLWILSESGPMALMSYLLVFGLALYYCLQIIKYGKRAEDLALALCMFIGVVGFMVISFFSYPRERIMHATYFMLILSLITAKYHSLIPLRRKRSGKSARWILPLFMVCSLACVILGLFRLKAEIHTKRAVQAISHKDWIAALIEIDKARSAFVDLDPTATPLLWYKGAALYVSGDKDGAFECYLKAYDYNPNHVQLLNNLGSCYEERGNHIEAIELYNKALSIAPGFEKTLVNMAAVLYNTGEYQKAYDALMHIEGRPSDPRYESFLGAIKAKLEPVEKH